LVHIWCTTCGRDLDWAQPEFVAAHPEHRCAGCPEPVPPAAIHATAEVISSEPLRELEATNEQFLQVVAEVEEAIRR
jgi:hypothetical protein